METIKSNLDLLTQMGDPVALFEFDVDLGDKLLSAACEYFDVKVGYLRLGFFAMKNVNYVDLSHRVIKIKAVDSESDADVVVLKYQLTKLTCVLASGVAAGSGFGLHNTMHFEQRYKYNFVGIEHK